VKYSISMSQSYLNLSATEQADLYPAKSQGDTEARDKLVRSCLPLAYSLATKFASNNKHVDIEDLIAEANLFLVKAVNDWDIAKGRLSTIATRYIYNALVDITKDSKYKINTKYSMPRNAVRDLKKIKEVGSTDIDVIAQKTGLLKSRVKTLMFCANGGRVNFDNLVFSTTTPHSPASISGQVKGCLADIEKLLQEHVDPYHRNIFLTWVNVIHKNARIPLTAKACGISSKEVSQSIRKTQKILKSLAHA